MNESIFVMDLGKHAEDTFATISKYNVKRERVSCGIHSITYVKFRKHAAQDSASLRDTYVCSKVISTVICRLH